MIKIIAGVLKENLKAVFLFGTEGAETGTAVALIETKFDLKIIDKISVNVYAGKHLSSGNWRAGVGIEKDIFDISNLFSIGGGVYFTRDIKDMFSKESPTNIAIGLSLSGRF